MPMLGIFIQTSGILEKVNNLMDSEKLLPKIIKLYHDIKEIRGEVKSNDQIESLYEKAKISGSNFRNLKGIAQKNY
nr:hypothetical protein [Rickettsia australis]